jgi:hypothetical protein
MNIVTEEEIVNGILNVSQNVENSVLVFFREIEDLETIEIDNTNKLLVSRFMDLKSLQVDDSAKTLREKLKEEILKKLPPSNIHKMKNVLL